jgi:hypothetical protein
LRIDTKVNVKNHKVIVCFDTQHNQVKANSSRLFLLKQVINDLMYQPADQFVFDFIIVAREAL